MKSKIIPFLFILGISFCTAQLSRSKFQTALELNTTAEPNQFLQHIIELENQFPHDANVIFLRGTYQYRVGKIDEAEKSYSNSIKIDSTMVLAYIARATIKAQKKQYDNAILDLTVALKHDNKNLQVYDLRSKILFQTGKREEALKDLNQKIALEPLEINHYVSAAKYCAKMNNSTKAEMYFAKAFTTVGMDIAIVDLAYAEYLMQLQRYDDALVRYLDAIEKNQKIVTGLEYNNIAVAYFKLQNFVSAKKYAATAINKSPLNLDFKCNFAAILSANNEWKKVGEVARSILILDNENVVAKDFLSMSILNNGISQTSKN